MPDASTRPYDLLRCSSDSEWLELRSHGIGGSDVAAIMGLSPWRTPYQVWADKVLGIREDISGRPAVEWGTILEPVVGDHYKHLHPDRTVRRVNAVCRSHARPWAQASLDYEVRDPDLGWGVLEIKTASLRSADAWADGVPLFYQTQVTHYLSVTGRPYSDVAVLIGGQDYREYRIERDEDDIAAVNAAVDAFWHDHVEAEVAPDVGAGDSPTVLARYPKPSEDLTEMDETPTLLTRWLSAKDDADSAKERVSALDAKLRQMIGDSRGIECPKGRLTWVRGESSRLDTKRLRAECPEVAERYMTKSTRDGGLRFRASKED